MADHHTPGPWLAVNSEDPSCNGWVVQSANGVSITGWGCVTQTEANARLIAAAPDLLAALEGVMKTPVPHAVGCDSLDTICTCHRAKALATIAKASGRAI